MGGGFRNTENNVNKQTVKSDTTIHQVSFRDMVTLLYNFKVMADMDQEMDAAAAMRAVFNRYNDTYMTVDREVLERLLWASNMTHELGTFWDYKGRKFSAFLRECLNPLQRDVTRYHDNRHVMFLFNRIYNWIERKILVK